jgi:hypothetical protein
MKAKLALLLTVGACAVAAPAVHAYPLDPGTGDRLETLTTSRTSQAVTKPAKQKPAKHKPRPKPPLEP